MATRHRGIAARSRSACGRLEPVGNGPREVERTRAQLATDVYLALPDDERAAVSASMATGLGVLWFGGRSGPDEYAAIRPAYATHLATALAQRGHLSTALSEHVRGAPAAVGSRTHPARAQSGPFWYRAQA
jgi:hypothetical protein